MVTFPWRFYCILAIILTSLGLLKIPLGPQRIPELKFQNSHLGGYNKSHDEHAEENPIFITLGICYYYFNEYKYPSSFLILFYLFDFSFFVMLSTSIELT